MLGLMVDHSLVPLMHEKKGVPFNLRHGGQLGNKREVASQVVLVVKNPPANAGDVRDVGLIPGWGRSPGEGHGNPLQYSCLENFMERGAGGLQSHRIARSWT